MKEIHILLMMALLMNAAIVICAIWGILGPMDSHLKTCSTACFIITMQITLLIGKLKSE